MEVENPSVVVLPAGEGGGRSIITSLLAGTTTENASGFLVQSTKLCYVCALRISFYSHHFCMVILRCDSSKWPRNNKRLVLAIWQLLIQARQILPYLMFWFYLSSWLRFKELWNNMLDALGSRYFGQYCVERGSPQWSHTATSKFV